MAIIQTVYVKIFRPPFNTAENLYFGHILMASFYPSRWFTEVNLQKLCHCPKTFVLNCTYSQISNEIDCFVFAPVIFFAMIQCVRQQKAQRLTPSVSPLPYVTCTFIILSLCLYIKSAIYAMTEAP